MYYLFHFLQPSNGEILTTASLTRSPVESHAESLVESSAVCDTSPRQTAGTLARVLKRSLVWPLHVSRTACAVPRRVCNWMGGKVLCLRQHLRENADDYTFLYELLGIGVPLLVVLYENLLQMQIEYGPVNLHTLRQWMGQHLGQWYHT